VVLIFKRDSAARIPPGKKTVLPCMIPDLRRTRAAAKLAPHANVFPEFP
jgi:hypothetical protein